MAAIAFMRAQGMTFEEIGAQYGVSRQAVHAKWAACGEPPASKLSQATMRQLVYPRIKRAMMEMELTPPKLAKKVGCSDTYLRESLKGKRNLNPIMWAKLAQVLGLTVEEAQERKDLSNNC